MHPSIHLLYFYLCLCGAQVSGTYHSDGALGAMARISAAAAKAQTDAAAALKALREEKMRELMEALAAEAAAQAKAFHFKVSFEVTAARGLIAADKVRKKKMNKR